MTSIRPHTVRFATIAGLALTLAACGGGAPAPDAAQEAAKAEAELAAQRAELEQREAELAEKQKALEEEQAAAEAARLELERAEAAKAEAAKAEAARAEAARAAAARPAPKPAATRPATSTPAPAPAPKVAQPVVVPSGTSLSIAFTSTITTKTAKVGDPVGARLTAPLVVDGRTIAPAGAAVRGAVTDVFSGSREIGGTPRLSVRFDQLSLSEGRSVAISADLAQEGKRESGRDAAKIAGGALIGAVVGKQIDDGKGAVIGGLLGGAAGAAIAKRTGGDLEIADGTAAMLVLTRSVEVR
jgi:hypothetical protein